MDQKSNYTRSIEIKTLFCFLKKNIKIIILISIGISLALSLCKIIISRSALMKETQITQTQVTDYLGTAKIFIGDDIDTSTAEALRAYLVGNDVLQNVIADLALDKNYQEIFPMISLANSTDKIIYVNVVGNDKKMVNDITESISNIGMMKISEKFHYDQVIILEPAYTESRTYNVDISNEVSGITILFKAFLKIAMIGFVIGLFLAVGTYVILFIVDDTINDEIDVEGYLKLSVLGEIPYVQNKKRYIIFNKKKKQRLSQYS